MADTLPEHEPKHSQGGCLCGAVRFHATVKAPETAVCHCGMCRRWAAGPFFAVECDDVVFDSDDGLSFFRSSEWAERGFCHKCGTSLMWKLASGGGYHVSLPAFDELEGVTFTSEIFIDQKPDYFDFANQTRKLTGEEVFALFNGEQGN